MDKKEKYIYQQMARRIGGTSTQKTCQKYAKAFVESLTTELIRSGEVRIENFGVFRVVETKGTGGVFKKYNIATGQMEERYFEQRYHVKFENAERFRADIEGKELTKSQERTLERKIKKAKENGQSVSKKGNPIKKKKTPEQIAAERKQFLERKR